MNEVRICICGHSIWEHEDYDFIPHECNVTDCSCQQFRDADDDEHTAAINTQDGK